MKQVRVDSIFSSKRWLFHTHKEIVNNLTYRLAVALDSSAGTETVFMFDAHRSNPKIQKRQQQCFDALCKLYRIEGWIEAAKQQRYFLRHE